MSPPPEGRSDPFTVPTPQRLDVERQGEHWWAEVDGRRLRLSNLDKVFWPEEGYTKGDLLAYYANLAPVILPYLTDRPLTMKRMPDGIAGPHFFEKNAPPHTPDWVRRCRASDERSPGKSIDFLTVHDTASLLFVANLGSIELHPLHSRCAALERPDYLFFDLDPGPEVDFEDVLAVAWHVRSALDALGLPSYPKTSGGRGIQVYVPLRTGPSYEQVRNFVASVGHAIRRADPARVSMEREPGKRTRKVFIDHSMNRRGANIVAAYSVRPEPGAPVSAPLTWQEIEDGVVRPRDLTIVTIHERLAQIGDLFRPVLAEPVDLGPTLEAFGIRSDEDAAARTSSGPVASRLVDYDAKRDLDRTPEPRGSRSADTGGNRFVVQKHDARRLHYDLRLERDGVLVSWAVPKGLPTKLGQRHLAVHTEDHPLEYGEFEGQIPAGNYGAGEVRIFDRGTYEPLSWEEGKITFRLHGERLRGEYHLVRTNRDWLILLSKASGDDSPPEPPAFRPMLAEGGYEPFDDPAWRFEPKLDGIRILADVTPETTRLWSRTGREQTHRYPELTNLAKHVNALRAVIDGEVIAPDDAGRPSFERLQQRMNLSSATEIDQARQRIPVQLHVFDLLWLDGEDRTSLPLVERRRLLESIVTPTGALRLVRYLDGEGTTFFEAARDLGLEGMVAKRLAGRYVPGRRSPDWRKIKAVRTQDCVVLGWTRGSGSRAGTFGALLVGAFADGELRWLGSVGTGFTHATLRDLLARLEALEVPSPPVPHPELRRLEGARWVHPELVCEVEYLEITEAGRLRAPSFKGLRPDKAPEECTLQRPAG